MKYRIEVGNYGGEIVMGTVSNEFVQYWITEPAEELVEYVTNLAYDGTTNEDVPELPNDVWYEISDIKHLYGAYSDSIITITNETTNEEITVDSPKFEYGADLDLEYIQECSEGEKYIPVLTVHNSEKGSFDTYTLETEEEFNPDELSPYIEVTPLGGIITGVLYKGEELESNYDGGDTNGKFTTAAVGWLDKGQLEDSEEV